MAMTGTIGGLKQMAREHLMARANWQAFAGARGRKAEELFENIMTEYLSDTNIETTSKPKDLRGIYGTHQASGRPHGIIPEYGFHNLDNDKRVYVEVKRQKAEGNAHERACKYWMPGIVASIQDVANQPKTLVPVWFVFTNGITTDSKYVQEISHWFKGHEANFILWEDMLDRDALVDHFEAHIMPMLV